MARFGELLTEELDGTNIHRLENIITLASDKHEAFDKFHLWFEETVRPAISSLGFHKSLTTFPKGNSSPLPHPNRR
jgi:hypothetical protein